MPRIIEKDNPAEKSEGDYVELRVDSADVKRTIASSLRVTGGKPGTAAVGDIDQDLFDRLRDVRLRLEGRIYHVVLKKILTNSVIVTVLPEE